MFPGSGGKSQPKQNDGKDDPSLDSVLPSPELKIEMVVVVMISLDQMRKSITDTFDPTITSTPPHQPPPSPWADPKDADEKPPTYEQATKVYNSEDHIRRKEELADPELQLLQKSALHAFSKWRVQVLKRLGETLKVRPEDAKNGRARHEAEYGAENLVDLQEDRAGDPVQYHPIKTRLASLQEDSREILLNSLLLLLLSLEHYSAYSRVLLLRIAPTLEIPLSVLNEKEDAIAHGLLMGAHQQMSADEAKRRDNNENAASKAWKVGLATVAGAAVIGLTGGLAAPLLAGAVGSVLGGIGLGGTAIAGLLGGLAGNFVLVGGLFGAYGGKMTGKMMEKYAKEVEDFEFIPLRRVGDDEHRLRVVVGVTGWLSDQQEVYLPWRVLGDQIEGFALQWEVEVLKKLGGSLLDTFKKLMIRGAAIEIIKRTVFAGLMITLWPLGLLTLGRALSNSFSVAQARADRAGEVLADALIHKAQGERPVTLIGYSLGARVVYSCLHTLAKRRAFGLVESAIFLGAPVSAESANWRAIRAVVADRVVNVYSRNDYVLGLAYRTSSITPNVAGLQAVDEVAGIENFNVSDLVSGHLRYRYLVGQILQRTGYEALDSNVVSQEKESLVQLDAQEQQMRKEAEARKTGKARRPSRPLDWDDILEEGDTDAAALDNQEIERRLRNLQLREQSEQSEQAPELPPRPPGVGSPGLNEQSEQVPMLPPRPSGLGDSKPEEHSEETSELPRQSPELERSARGHAVDVDSEDDVQGHRITMVDTEDD